MDNKYKIIGDVTIPDDKRKEFNGYVIELLKICGIRKTCSIMLNGAEVNVVEYPIPDEEGVVSFNYSIFEKEKREMARFDTKNCQLDCPDRGYMEYGLVMNILMTMQIAYSDSPCILMYDDAPCEMRGYVVCAKQLLGITLDFTRQSNCWENIPTNVEKQMFWFAIKKNEGLGKLEILTRDKIARFTEIEERLRDWQEQYRKISIPMVEGVNVEEELANVLVLQQTIWHTHYISKLIIDEFLANKTDIRHKKALYLYKQIIEEDIESFPEMTRNQVLNQVIKYTDKKRKCEELEGFAALLVNIELRREVLEF